MPVEKPAEPNTEETAAELLAQAANERTLDEFYRRQKPPQYQIEQAIEASRRERARFFVTDGERKQKRKG